ncbi:H(+)-ATPase 4 [Striga asiatica]|uniref:H(+)-ATPase 4 n=1 Tax=Striga asiatica TaxID=4170 RepID=A0A5A7PYR1_STRAF|nr:H(+)-ATPase 4 [Striga asiatica]
MMRSGYLRNVERLAEEEDELDAKKIMRRVSTNRLTASGITKRHQHGRAPLTQVVDFHRPPYLVRVIYGIGSGYSSLGGGDAAKPSPKIVDEYGPLIHTVKLHTLHPTIANLQPEDLKLHTVHENIAFEQFHDQQ